MALPSNLKARLKNAQDVLLLKFAEENVLEMLVLLAQCVEEEENRNWNLLLLDIFSLIFVKEEPTEVIGSADVMNGAWKTSERRKVEILESQIYSDFILRRYTGTEC